MFNMQTHYNEYSKIRRTIHTLPYEYQRDLKNMLVTLDQLMLQIHIEQVTCKQRRKVTKNYDQLLNIYEEYKENLEQQLVLAILSS